MMKPISGVSGVEPDYLKRLSVIIPAYNEASGIVETIKALTEQLPDSEIIVVDDGSGDGTADQVLKFPTVKLLRHSFNRGYGGAIKTGLMHATGEYIAWFDADNEHRVEDLKAMVERLDSEGLAAVLGRREQSVNAVRGVGKFLIRMLARLLQVKAGTDLNCGLRVFRREVIMRYLHLLPDTYSASLTSTIILVVQRYLFVFHRITINRRIGTSKVALSDGFGTLVLVLRVITLFAPLRIFLRLSLLLMFFGSAYGLGRALITGLGFPVLAGIMIMAGLVIGALGLIADQISQMRLSALNPLPVARLDRAQRPTDTRLDRDQADPEATPTE